MSTWDDKPNDYEHALQIIERLREDLAAKIEAFFLKDGKWELSVVPDGSPYLIPGRWLEIPDTNYAFRPVDLVEAINQQGTR